jgi:predicted RNase H-like HicB family nuclease
MDRNLVTGPPSWEKVEVSYLLGFSQNWDTRNLSWNMFERRQPYECRILLIPEDGGGYSVHLCRLPGVVSQGETEAEAIENIKDAFRAVLESYEADRVRIPWTDNPVCVDKPAGSKEQWILVDV